MNSLQFETITIEDLFSELCEGRFAVPKLQRAFVWNGVKATKLLDSVYRGMPIGALTIWDTSKKNRTLLRRSLEVLPNFKDHNSRVWFVLDGQQRLSVLYRIFMGGEQTNGSRQAVDFRRVVFRVTNGDEVSRFQYRKPVPGEWISLPDLLASNWKSRVREVRARGLKRLENCRSIIKEYRVPLVTIASESLDEARELFIRINSLDTPLGAADRAFARASRFDLRELAETSREDLPLAFQNVRYEMFLQTRALLDGIEDVGERAFEQVAKKWDQRIAKDSRITKQFSHLWHKQTKAIQRAIDCLIKDFCV